MMRSLAIKLTLAFLFVSLAGIALVAILASRITAVEFGNFINAQNQTLIAEQLADYYETNDGWVGVDGRRPTPSFIGGRRPGFGPDRAPFTVVDAQGFVVIPGGGRRPGEQIPHQLLQAGFPIEVEGETVGYLIEWGELERQQFRNSFALRVNIAILLSALGAVGLSLVLGGLLSRSLTRPLQEITEATEKVSQGELDQQVPVRTKDELGQLAISFNRMSSQLNHSQNLRRQMTADIAHDFGPRRSPARWRAAP
jgi:two-component system sensor histidine kinase BaeS